MTTTINAVMTNSQFRLFSVINGISTPIRLPLVDVINLLGIPRKHFDNNEITGGTYLDEYYWQKIVQISSPDKATLSIYRDKIVQLARASTREITIPENMLSSSAMMLLKDGMVYAFNEVPLGKLGEISTLQTIRTEIAKAIQGTVKEDIAVPRLKKFYNIMVSDNHILVKFPFQYCPRLICDHYQYFLIDEGAAKSLEHLDANIVFMIGAKYHLNGAYLTLEDGKRLRHYHTLGASDCWGDVNLPTTVKNFDVLEKLVPSMEQTLVTINAGSAADFHPLDMPLLSSIISTKGPRVTVMMSPDGTVDITPYEDVVPTAKPS